MTDSNLPEQLQSLIKLCVPTYPAAELLVFLSQRPKEQLKAEEIATEIRPAALSISAIGEYLRLFKRHGLVDEQAESCFQYGPASPQLEIAVNELIQAFNEKPVTLIRTIYAIADNKIQHFADSFKFKSD